MRWLSWPEEAHYWEAFNRLPPKDLAGKVEAAIAFAKAIDGPAVLIRCTPDYGLWQGKFWGWNMGSYDSSRQAPIECIVYPCGAVRWMMEA